MSAIHSVENKSFNFREEFIKKLTPDVDGSETLEDPYKFAGDDDLCVQEIFEFFDKHQTFTALDAYFTNIYNTLHSNEFMQDIAHVENLSMENFLVSEIIISNDFLNMKSFWKLEENLYKIFQEIFVHVCAFHEKENALCINYRTNNCTSEETNIRAEKLDVLNNITADANIFSRNLTRDMYNYNLASDLHCLQSLSSRNELYKVFAAYENNMDNIPEEVKQKVQKKRQLAVMQKIVKNLLFNTSINRFDFFFDTTVNYFSHCTRTVVSKDMVLVVFTEHYSKVMQQIAMHKKLV